MSLSSATGLIRSVKEYFYRGVQQLPIVLTSTSLIFAIAAGSIAHLNLALGMGVLMPIYTAVLQVIFYYFFSKSTYMVALTRSTGDTCNLVPAHMAKPLEYYTGSKATGGDVVPSYWLMSFAFFVGYTISNALDTLSTPAQPFSDAVSHENRNSHAVTVLITTSLFAAAMLYIRFVVMSGCEGREALGFGISGVAAVGAGSIGYAIYTASKTSCGPRSVDIFGILSQMLPASATTQNPVVCSSD